MRLDCQKSKVFDGSPFVTFTSEEINCIIPSRFPIKATHIAAIKPAKYGFNNFDRVEITD